MTANTAQISTDECFGGCPECGASHGYFNLGRDHWFKCDIHKTMWVIGANLFSSWRDQTEADWEANRQKYGSYRVVEPIHQEPTPEQAEQNRRDDEERAEQQAAVSLLRRLLNLSKKHGADSELATALTEAGGLIMKPWGGYSLQGGVVSVDPCSADCPF